MNDNITNYFQKKNWNSVEIGKGLLFFKNGTNGYLEENINNFNTKMGKIPFSEVYQIFLEYTESYFKQELDNLERLNPMNIYEGYKQNSFVSTGLEFYYPHLYNEDSIKGNDTYIIQPSVRFKMDFFAPENYGNDTKYDYSSIAFNNLSLVDVESNDDTIEKIEIMLNYLSKLKIYAGRVKFLISNKTKYKDNDISYYTIKFYVDNLEIGDILCIKTKDKFLTEYGFGLERLLSRFVSKKYKDLFIKEEKYDTNLLLAANFLTGISMFDNSKANRGAKSHINKIVNNIEKNSDIMNIDLIYQNYLYWKEILNGTAYKESFEHVTQKYNELVKKRRR